VIRPFIDSTDKKVEFPKGRSYAKGDTFPFRNQKVSNERLKSLLTERNRQGYVLIKEKEIKKVVKKKKGDS